VTEPGRQHSFTDFTPRLAVFRQGYSLFVRILKYTLPLAALAIVGLLFSRLNTTTNPQLQNLAASPESEKTTPGQIELVQPKYEGVDEQGRPYTVTADKAVRAVNEPDTVLFTTPMASITLSDDSWLATQAKTGTFDHKTEILDLKDGVSLFHDSGYGLQTPELRIYLKQKTARAPKPVQGQGPAGTLTARDLSVLDGGNLIVFGGPAKVTFFKLPGGKGRG
jgi:lipopolysaccharide export system protein LptC